ncbi:hypothetical protein [Bradyrhizobium sp. AZCC 2230]|uniref:hypothetical protein n=1 Tax=Bradyrhizobium sp. AZCC 2230 TaxID=3117021 RepID=UPI002FF15E26
MEQIGIARSILGAEHSSVLSLANDPTEFAKFDQTWLHQFFAMAKRNLKREDLLKTFQNVTIINFNYDRCVEQYLFHAFHQRGAVSRDDARTVVRSLRMIRPYGALGSLWGELAFGDYSTNPISAADRILTLTEQLAQDVDDAIKKAILDAHVIVILGFGFHEQNMEALTVDSEYKHRNIFATLFGLDYQITGQVREHIGRAVKTDPPYVQGQQTVCGTFLRNFEIPILRAAA